MFVFQKKDTKCWFNQGLACFGKAKSYLCLLHLFLIISSPHTRSCSKLMIQDYWGKDKFHIKNLTTRLVQGSYLEFLFCEDCLKFLILIGFCEGRSRILFKRENCFLGSGAQFTIISSSLPPIFTAPKESRKEKSPARNRAQEHSIRWR